MTKDIQVLSINADSGEVVVHSDLHVPYQLRGALVLNEYNARVGASNLFAFQNFLAMRTLALDRDNAKKILNILALPQGQDAATRAQVALYCRGVSLQDTYWVRSGNEQSLTWNDVSIRSNSLSRIVAQVALQGVSLTLQGKVQTPELTTRGSFAKCWRKEDGDLFLYKANGSVGNESKVEVEVSHLLDMLKLDHVAYTLAHVEGYKADLCKCKCITSDDKSIIHAGDLRAYFGRTGSSPDNVLLQDKIAVYNMLIVDYLISNSDRHGENWGFYYSPDTMQIMGCHPLFDHNNAFDRALMQNITGGNSLVESHMTQRDAAKSALRKLDYFYFPVFTKKDFIDKAHYNSFKVKAKELGFSVK